MAVGKISFTSLETNARLTNKRQDKIRYMSFNCASRFNPTKCLLEATSSASKDMENSHQSSFFNKVVKAVKNFFKNNKPQNESKTTEPLLNLEKQKVSELPNSETPKVAPLTKNAEISKAETLEAPYKVDWTDFSSIKGELINNDTKVIRDNNGNIIKKFICQDFKDYVWSVTDYDPKTGNRIKCTVFGYDDGKTVSRMYDFAPETGTQIKYTTFRRNGTIEVVFEYDPKTGNSVKHTRFYDDGAISYISEYNPKTDMEIRFTTFHSLGEKNVKSITNYDPETGGVIDHTEYLFDGKTVHTFVEYGSEGAKTTYFNADGTIRDVKFPPKPIEHERGLC